MGFLAQLEALTVTPDSVGRVVIDSAKRRHRHGREGPNREGRRVLRTTRVTVGAAPSGAANNPDVFVIGDTTTVDDFVSALKNVGLKADVVIGVLEAVDKAGALFGTLVVN